MLNQSDLKKNKLEIKKLFPSTHSNLIILMWGGNSRTDAIEIHENVNRTNSKKLPIWLVQHGDRVYYRRSKRKRR